MPSPLGARCRTPLGGLYRSPLGALACPALGCPDALEVTFSGVDAAICSSYCRFGTSPFNSTKMKTLSVDGTYAIPFTAEFPFGQTCRYGISNQSGNYGSFDRWNTTPFCNGAPADTITAEDLDIRVDVDKASGEILQVSMTVTGVSGGWNLNWFPFSASATGKFYDEAIGNAVTCTGSGASSGGTATVVKA